MQICSTCHRPMPEINRFCTHCGQRLQAGGSTPASGRSNAGQPEQLNLNVLYGMIAGLIIAVVFPPWETPPSQTPEFLGMHFILSPPTPDAIVSRMLVTIELVTITIAGLYGAFLWRKK